MTPSSSSAGGASHDRKVLPNGLTVLVMERRHLPTLSMTLLFPSGIAMEPEDRPGLSFFASQVLPMGTSGRSAMRLAEDVDSIGATLSTGCEHDYATIDVSGLARSSDALFDILTEVAQSPAFHEEEVERKRSQILGLLERQKDNYVDVVRNRFFEEIYGSHPYHRTKEGTPESVTAATREDLLSLWRASYVPSGAILAIVGDIDSSRAIRAAEERFGGWSSPQTPRDLPAPPADLGERRVVTIQREAKQATIRMGNVAIERNHPGYCAAVITNYILGGSGFGSRLMRNLREDHGLTYGVYSSFSARKRPGSFFASTRTGLATMNEAIRQMLLEIDRFLESGPTEEELAWAKRFFTGSMPLTLETNDQLAQKLLEKEFFGLEDQFWLRDLERMQGVTAKEAIDLAREQIRPARFAIIVLADFREEKLEIDPPGAGRPQGGSGGPGA